MRWGTTLRGRTRAHRSWQWADLGLSQTSWRITELDDEVTVVPAEAVEMETEEEVETDNALIGVVGVGGMVW